MASHPIPIERLAYSVTSRDLPMNLWGADVVLPAGTDVMLLKNASGTAPFNKWAVQSEALLMKLTGNTHDPKYRYAWVPDDAVTMPKGEVSPVDRSPV